MSCVTKRSATCRTPSKSTSKGPRPLPFKPFLLFVGTLFLTFLGLVFVTFMIGRVVPIDPVLAAVGDRAPADVYEQTPGLRWGLHLPLWQQFFIYVGDVFRGDLGRERADCAACARGYFSGVSGDAGAFDGGGFDRVGGGHSFGRGGGCVSRAVAGSSGAGLLGWSGIRCRCFWLGLFGLLLFYAKLDWVPGPGRLDIFYEDLVPADHRCDLDRCGRWPVTGRFGGMRSAI